jgi:hypothetical protein
VRVAFDPTVPANLHAELAAAVERLPALDGCVPLRLNAAVSADNLKLYAACDCGGAPMDAIFIARAAPGAPPATVASTFASQLASHRQELHCPR